MNLAWREFVKFWMNCRLRITSTSTFLWCMNLDGL